MTYVKSQTVVAAELSIVTIHMGEAIYKVAISLCQQNRIYITKVYKKTDFLRPVNKKVKTATIFVVKTRS